MEKTRQEYIDEVEELIKASVTVEAAFHSGEIPEAIAVARIDKINNRLEEIVKINKGVI